jgi:rhodanese-related sulfurtransferase
MQLNAQNKSISRLNCADFYQELILNDNAQLFDIRKASLYKISRIKSALSAETKITFSSYFSCLKKEDPIFIYCEQGVRSKQCATWLKSQGFKNIIELDEGFNHWVKQGFPVDSNKVNIKNKVNNGAQ